VGNSRQAAYAETVIVVFRGGAIFSRQSAPDELRLAEFLTCLNLFDIGGVMSALGQKQIFALHQPMSALPPKADIPLCDWNVR
jgi:hypothetical protein